MHTPEGRHLSGIFLACFHLSVERVFSKLSNRFCLLLSSERWIPEE